MQSRRVDFLKPLFVLCIAVAIFQAMLSWNNITNAIKVQSQFELNPTIINGEYLSYLMNKGVDDVNSILNPVEVIETEEISLCSETIEPLKKQGDTNVTPIIPKPYIAFTESEINLLERTVEAEAGICSYEGKLMVARVIINRVQSEQFPNTLKEVIYAKRQFQVVANGRINKVKVTEETKKVVQEAITVKSDFDALYFANKEASDAKWYKWMEDNLTYVGTDDMQTFFK